MTHAFPGTPVEIVSLRVTGIGLMPKLEEGLLRPRANSRRAPLKTETIFRANGELRKISTQFLDRALLEASTQVEGAAVLIQTDTTTVVPPDWRRRSRIQATW